MTTQRSKARRKELARGVTQPKQCERMIPPIVPMMPPFRCEARHFRNGQCAEHYREVRQASETRGIEARARRATIIASGKTTKRGRVPLPSVRIATRTTTYIPKSQRKSRPEQAAA